MTAENSAINLFKEKSAIPEYIQPVQSQLRNFSLLALIVAVVAGSASLLVYMSIRVRYQLLVGQKTKLTRQLETLRPKEIMFTAIKSRIGVVDKAVSSTKPMSQLVNTVTGFISPPGLSSIEFSELGEATINVRVQSLEELLNITGALIDLSDRSVIKRPILDSLSVNQDGIKANITFKPVFQ